MAEIVALDRSNLPVARDEYVGAIQLWCKTRSTADALTREEIGAMPKFDRIDAQRKALILGLAHYYRTHERADVAPGVAVILTLLSDNDKGCASISQPTLAKLFGRSLSSIGDAQRRLKDDGIIVTGRGRYAATYPVIPRAVTHSYNHLTWLVSAICEQDETSNLPVPQVDCQSTGPAGGLEQSSDESGGLDEVNQPDEPVSIHRPDRCLIHYKSSTTLNRATQAAAIGIATALGAMPVAAAPADPPAIVQAAAKPSLLDMTDRMMDAAGTALANPAASPGLLTTSDLKRWLDGGCDFEVDIVPTIRASAMKRPPASIRSWGYFTQAIADAKALRERPMPKGNVTQSAASNWHQEQDKALAFIFAK